MMRELRTNGGRAMQELTTFVMNSTIVALSTLSLSPIQYAQTLLDNSQNIEYHGQHDPRPALQNTLDQALFYLRSQTGEN